MNSKPPLILVVLDPKSRVLSRYQGRHRTHQAEFIEPITANSMEAIQYFRRYPDASYAGTAA